MQAARVLLQGAPVGRLACAQSAVQSGAQGCSSASAMNCIKLWRRCSVRRFARGKTAAELPQESAERGAVQRHMRCRRARATSASSLPPAPPRLLLRTARAFAATCAARALRCVTRCCARGKSAHSHCACTASASALCCALLTRDRGGTQAMSTPAQSDTRVEPSAGAGACSCVHEGFGCNTRCAPA
jgi:hypothetical protein